MHIEKNLPYNSDLWRVIRGEIPVVQFLEGLATPNCCADSGATSKIAFNLNGLSGYEYRKSEMALMLCLNTLADVYNEKGGSTNMVSESLLRECTGVSCNGAGIYFIQYVSFFQFYLLSTNRIFCRRHFRVVKNYRTRLSTPAPWRGNIRYLLYTALFHAPDGFS